MNGSGPHMKAVASAGISMSDRSMKPCRAGRSVGADSAPTSYQFCERMSDIASTWRRSPA